jgi:hypothetical protein
MPEAPRKYQLITEAQLQAARRFWPQVSDKTWTLTLRRTDEPMVLNKAAHKGVGFVTITAPEPHQTRDGMYYRRDIDVLILMSGETPLAQ